MNDSDNSTRDDADADLGALLRAAGPRPKPAASMEAEVLAAVEAEWRTVTQARSRRRRSIGWAAAAGVAVAALGVWIARPLYAPAPALVASISRIEGAVEYRTDRQDQWSPLPTGAQLRDGDELRTGASGRVALELASGVQLRLDNSTRIALNDVHHTRLRRGGVYVDSGVTGADDARALELDTPAGDVRHLGTQYQARVAGNLLQVAVREGLVSIVGNGADAVGRAGEQVTLQDGEARHADLAVNSDAWAWIGGITPPFAIEGRSVAEFLAWAARETGREVVYESPQAEAQARSIVLKGSVAGLAPDTAVAAVLSTTQLRPSLDEIHIAVRAK